MSAGSITKFITPSLKAAINGRSSKISTELLKSSTALLSSAPEGGKHTLPSLSYDYGALEPSISAETMTIHHTKHHNTYVVNLNATLEKIDSALSSGDPSSLISLQGALKFNGGGHINHTLFWENLCAPGSSELSDDKALKGKIVESFGSVDKMIEQMSAKSVAVQGSGWGWLGYNTTTELLEIATCANQDPLEATTGLKPIIGVDVWEHAYYVDYRNVRPDYVKAVWDVINWDEAESRFLAASK